MPRFLSVLSLLLAAILAFVPPAGAQGVPPPLPPEMQGVAAQEVAEWYYADNGAVVGPVTLSQLGELVGQGTAGAQTPVWKEGMPGWARLAEVPELAPLLAKEGGGPAVPEALSDEEVRRFLLGTWREEGTHAQSGALLSYTIEITFREDGSYLGLISLQAPQSSGGESQVQPFGGIYSVRTIDKTHFLVSMTDEITGQPETTSLEILSQDSVRNTADGRLSFRVR